MPRKLYSLVEARGVLRISRTKLFGLIKAGDLRSVPIGRRRFIPEDALDEYLSAQEAAEAVLRAGGDAA